MEHVKGASAEVLGGAFGAVRGALRGRQTGQTGQTALELRPLSTVASFPGAVVGSYGVSNRAAFESSQIQAFLMRHARGSQSAPTAAWSSASFSLDCGDGAPRFSGKSRGTTLLRPLSPSIIIDSSSAGRVCSPHLSKLATELGFILSFRQELACRMSALQTGWDSTSVLESGFCNILSATRG